MLFKQGKSIDLLAICSTFEGAGMDFGTKLS